MRLQMLPSEMHQLLISIASIASLIAALGMLRICANVSVRKLLHLLSGPIFFYSLRDYQFTLGSAFLAALIPLSGGITFLLAKNLNLQAILRIIQRGEKSYIAGVVQYAILWSMWPFCRLYGKEDAILPSLVNLTLGDGLCGCAAYLKPSTMPAAARAQKTNTGSGLYLAGSLLGMTLLGFDFWCSVCICAIGCAAERLTYSNDNLWIFSACALATKAVGAIRPLRK